MIIHSISQMVTSQGKKQVKGAKMKELLVLEDVAIVIIKGIIKDIGPTQEILAKYKDKSMTMISALGKTVTPGYVDSHSHFLFGGERSGEYNMRLAGASYVEIMEAGGGIINSVNATRDASYEELLVKGRKTLKGMMAYGITTLEGKSGYGLDMDTEIKQLQVMKELKRHEPVHIIPTFMGAHSVPHEHKSDPDKYIDWIIQDILPMIKEQELASFCDVFCEDKVFSIEQSKRLLERAKSLDLGVKLHADEIVDLGGTSLGVELGATSVDHLLQVNEEGIDCLAKGDTVATLLPMTAFTLREPYAPARKLIDSGAAVALATDYNPGSCPSFSLPLLIALATIEMKMSIEEVLTALTLNGAAALGLAHHIGTLEIGKEGDLLIHDVDHYTKIPYRVGENTVITVIKSGVQTI